MNKALIQKVCLSLILSFVTFNIRAQIISTVAGNVIAGYSGNLGAATSAELNRPSAVALDSKGNLYISDSKNLYLRRVDAGTNIITTIAGTGTSGYFGDNGSASLASFGGIAGLAIDTAGNIFIADYGANCIRKITKSTGIITTVAGNDTSGYSGDGGPAVNARLWRPTSVALDDSGNIYIADFFNFCIRKVTLTTGIISTVAGIGTASGDSGDNSPATSAKLRKPSAVTVDASGNIYIADQGSNRIRKVTQSTGVITTVAGNGNEGRSGNNDTATSAELYKPSGLALDSSGNLYISDELNHRICKVDANSGILTTIAGNGVWGFSGDNGDAWLAELNFPQGIALDKSGNLYIADYANNCIRKVSNATTVTGDTLPSVNVIDTTQFPHEPRVYLNTCEPVTSITKTICLSGCDYTISQLQTAIDDAIPGTTILLQAGVIYNYPITLREKTGSDWIVIKSAQMNNLPDIDHRVFPADSVNMAVLRCSIGYNPVTTQARAHHYRFEGIDITSEGFTYGLFWIGNNETALTDLPHDITIDRCYIHGNAAKGTIRGVGVNGINIAVINSYISDCKSDYADAQAIGCFTGTTIKIVNNYLEGSGENVMFGGSDPSVCNLVPSDIEIRGNHFSKPLSWFIKDSTYGGTPWCVKNLLEFKNAQRVLVEGNYFEHNWASCQSGFSWLVTPRNQDGTAPWSVTTDITYRKNILIHAASGFNVLVEDDNFSSQATSRILLENNLFEDIGGNWDAGTGDKRLYQFLGAPHVSILHNTCVKSAFNVFILASGLPTHDIFFENNLNPNGVYGCSGDGIGVGNPAINYYFRNSVFTKNAIWDGTYNNGGTVSNYPANNYFPADSSVVGFADYAAGDFHLASGSPYKNLATNGKDLGADINSLDAATSGCIIGYYKNCSSASGVSTFKTEQRVFVYPEPMKDKLEIVISGIGFKRINVFDIAGKQINDLQFSVSSTNETQIEIKRGSLSKGMYVYKIEMINAIHTGKFIVE